MTNKANLALIAIAVLAVASSLYSWYMPQPVITKTEYVNVPVIKETVKIKRIEVPVEKIVTIEKEVVVQKLNLPDWIKTDKDIQVIATASIEPYEGTTDAVATLNTRTGESSIIAKHRPLSLFGLISQKEIGIRYGVGTNSPTPYVSVYGHYNFLRVGSLYMGGYGEVNQAAAAIAMIQTGYRW